MVELPILSVVTVPLRFRERVEVAISCDRCVKRSNLMQDMYFQPLPYRDV